MNRIDLLVHLEIWYLSKSAFTPCNRLTISIFIWCAATLTLFILTAKWEHFLCICIARPNIISRHIHLINFHLTLNICNGFIFLISPIFCIFIFIWLGDGYLLIKILWILKLHKHWIKSCMLSRVHHIDIVRIIDIQVYSVSNLIRLI